MGCTQFARKCGSRPCCIVPGLFCLLEKEGPGEGGNRREQGEKRREIFLGRGYRDHFQWGKELPGVTCRSSFPSLVMASEETTRVSLPKAPEKCRMPAKKKRRGRLDNMTRLGFSSFLVPPAPITWGPERKKRSSFGAFYWKKIISPHEGGPSPSRSNMISALPSLANTKIGFAQSHLESYAKRVCWQS